MESGNVVRMYAWEVHQFSWGAAVFDKGGKKYTEAYLYPDAQHISLEHLNVLLHDNGIEFLGGESK